MFKNTFFSAFLFGLAGLMGLVTPPAIGVVSAGFGVLSITLPAPVASLTDTTPPAAAAKSGKQPGKQQVTTKTAGRTTPKPVSRVEAIKPAASPIAALTHATWDSLLQEYVAATGKVNYKGLKANPARLEAYCRFLADNVPQDNWPRQEKLAYWINAYNAFTMKLIVDNYPTASILRFDGGKTWDVKRITLGGKKYSLNQIENEIIRPQFQEPRIHFAINCAAKSCPPLYNHAYTAANLDTTLEVRARQFINNTRYNTITPGKATVSKIFDWYGADFGDLRKYLNKYAETPLQATVAIRFDEYDWDLNE